MYCFFYVKYTKIKIILSNFNFFLATNSPSKHNAFSTSVNLLTILPNRCTIQNIKNTSLPLYVRRQRLHTPLVTARSLDNDLIIKSPTIYCNDNLLTVPFTPSTNNLTPLSVCVSPLVIYQHGPGILQQQQATLNYFSQTSLSGKLRNHLHIMSPIHLVGFFLQ